ncbi:hypothetical protein HCQ94_01345 [Actinomyces sp. zg-332]|uniref:THUMP-like domain-containing protein n=1 Tax=Actinomyces sp. zg-332 TaxID=2708340 RepID=UPI0014230274|nr:hypothetical protein [Actinomyces sp. zg-332]QPK94380.1 hypothetical protein HCQ94_01345 [Actinomyces sp. zg-332]
MSKNILLAPKAQELYEKLLLEQTQFFLSNKENNKISESIYNPKLLASSFIPPAQIQTLRKTYGAEIVSAVLTQLDLQKQAFIKHGEELKNVLFLRTSLEQSTRYIISKIHAKRFIKSAPEKIGDLGCGVAIDTIGLCNAYLERKKVINDKQETAQTQSSTKENLFSIKAYELEEEVFEIAKHNLRHYDFAEVRNEDINSIDFEKENFTAVYADPARRKNGKRLMNPADWSPSLDTIYGWIKHCPNVGAKIAPGIDYKFLHPDSETNWLSINGELVEASIWFGDLKNHTGKTATVIKTDKYNKVTYSKTHSFDNNSTGPSQEVETTDLPIAKNLYITEVDPAILRANGLSWVANKINGKLISDNISYLVTQETCKNTDILPLIKQWEIIDYCNLKTKKINELLQQHNIGSLEIKKRGTDISPDILRKGLKLKGKEKSTIFLTRYDSKHIALLAKQI